MGGLKNDVANLSGEAECVGQDSERVEQHVDGPLRATGYCRAARAVGNEA